MPIERLSTTQLADDFVFLEGPRWRGDRLWLSDMWGLAVYTLTTGGAREKIVDVPGRPSGLGFLPDGTPLIVSMSDRRILRFRGGRLELHADLGSLASADVNDLLVDTRGRAWAGHFGSNVFAGEPSRSAELILVEPDGRARIAAKDLAFPNGMVLTDGGSTLVVAETFARQLTAFDVAADGSLGRRRVFASLGEYTPDGICLDQRGAIWVSAFQQGEFLRVEPGGRITHAIGVDGRRAVACQLGGPDGRTLFCLTFAGAADQIASGARKARVEIVRVEVAGAGSP